MTIKEASNQSLKIFSVQTKAQLWELQKKGDFGIGCFDTFSKFAVFSDCLSTRVFQTDLEKSVITCLNQKIENENKIE